ncbi:MAG: hemin receptor [Gammaproteobacteria bacterium]|nr:hemin receptor [Gammaproteobacteria bacterium]MBT8135280.1 hemin receptor [Gammaproteobacteria bacterium]NNJ49404.1 hemin receptor [Gammaproteobacteria bacterium]
MTPQQKELVQKTWVMVVPIADTAAELFYGRLFELEPEYKKMFKNDMTEQGKKLMKTINIAVEALDDVEPLVPVLKKMGADHAGYGVKERDYNVVGAALLWTLEKGLGDAFTDEVKNAWGAVYELLASVMKSGAAEAEQAA